MITSAIDEIQEYFEKYEEPQNHKAALLGASVVTLDIGARLLYPLARAGVRTVGDLLQLRKKGFRRIGNIGRSGAIKIEEVLMLTGLVDIEGFPG